ncbi:hypothetical protein ACFL59_09180 [Planctomycetota bacterium]
MGSIAEPDEERTSSNGAVQARERGQSSEGDAELDKLVFVHVAAPGSYPPTVVGLLPPTDLVFNASNRGHRYWGYLCDPYPEEEALKLPSGENLIELLPHGKAPIPPASSEDWVHLDRPLRVRGDDLRRIVGTVASAILLGRIVGRDLALSTTQRGDLTRALAGMLLKDQLGAEETLRLVHVMLAAATSSPRGEMLRLVQVTAAALGDGKRVPGRTRLTYLIGSENVDLIRRWLCLPPRPTIIINGGFPRDVVLRRIAEALRDQRDVDLYVRSGRLVAARFDRNGELAAKPLSKEEARILLATHLYWLRLGNDAALLHQDTPPATTITDFLSAARDFQFPRIRAALATPTLAPDTWLPLHVPDYYPESQFLLMQRPGETFLPIPLDPTRDEVERSVQRVRSVFGGYKFPHESSLSAVFAAALTILVRHSIPGPIPMFLVQAATMGVGKTLLVRAIVMLATGAEVIVDTKRSRREQDQRLVKILIVEDRPAALIDNVLTKLLSDIFPAVVTARRLPDGELRTVIFFTGQNLQIAECYLRRVISITIDPGCLRPELRDYFEHPDEELLRHILEHRMELVRDLLTILRGYVAAGRPLQPGLKPWGSFRGWEVIRHALVWGGLADPLDGQLSDRAVHDPDLDTVTAAVSVWFAKLRSRWFTTKELLTLAEEQGWKEEIGELARLGGGGGSLSSRLGYALRRYRDRLLVDEAGRVFRVERRARSWRVVRLDPGPHADGDADPSFQADAAPSEKSSTKGAPADETHGSRERANSDVPISNPSSFIPIPSFSEEIPEITKDVRDVHSDGEVASEDPVTDNGYGGGAAPTHRQNPSAIDVSSASQEVPSELPVPTASVPHEAPASYRPRPAGAADRSDESDLAQRSRKQRDSGETIRAIPKTRSEDTEDD